MTMPCRCALAAALVCLLGAGTARAAAPATTAAAAGDSVTVRLQVTAKPSTTFGPAQGTPGHHLGPLPRAAGILTVGGLMALWAHDEENPDAAQDFLDRVPFEPAVDIGNTYGSGTVVGSLSLGVWLTGKLAGAERTTAVGGDLCESFLLGGAVTWGLKAMVNRPRPTGGHHSFPSGHTTVAFGVVPVVGHHFGWKASVPATLLAVSTAMGRMEDRHHYFSDVIFGAAVGLACGDLVAGEGFLPGHARVAATGQGVGVSVPF